MIALLQRGEFCPLRLVALITKFGVYVSLEHSTRNSRLGDVSLKDYKIIWRIKIQNNTWRAKYCYGYKEHGW